MRPWRPRPSVQTIHPVDATADAVADLYFRWVDTSVPATRVLFDGEDVVHMHVLGLDAAALTLRTRSTGPRRTAYEVVGGFLVGDMPGGEFSFERIDQATLRISLDGFRPSLPRAIYQLTQAAVHSFIMWWFGHHVRKARPTQDSE